MCVRVCVCVMFCFFNNVRRFRQGIRFHNVCCVAVGIAQLASFLLSLSISSFSCCCFLILFHDPFLCACLFVVSAALWLTSLIATFCQDERPPLKRLGNTVRHKLVNKYRD